MKIFIPIVLSVVALSGCASKKKKEELPPAMTVGVAPITSEYTGVEQAPTYVNTYAAKPIMSSPVVRKVYVEAYIDENGNAYGPQEKYIVEKAPEFNIDALRHPSKAYVPQEMQPAMNNPGSVMVGNPQASRTATQTKSIRELYNINQVVVTGFVERSQEPQVAEIEAKYAGKMVRIFDEDLGWILVPKTVLQPQT